MQTGTIQTWTGNPLEIGPLYPFVGSEWLLFALCVGLWTVWQVRSENAEYARKEST
jgi:hypothetical protein